MASTVMLKLPLSEPRARSCVGLAADLAHQEVEVAAHQRLVEGLVARGHRGVGGEDGVAAHVLFRRLVEAVARAHPLAHALQAQEGHVALVHVPDRGVDAQGVEGAHAAHPQHDLLAQPHLAAAHVEDARDGPVGGVVQGDVGVEHEHRHLAHLGLPHRGLHHPARQVDGHREHAAVRGLDGQDGQAGEVVVRVDVLLEAVVVDGLPEVAGAVEQPHAHEGHPEVGGRLAVVAGQHAQAARVDAQGLVDAELHGEVGDRPGQRRLGSSNQRGCAR